MNKLKIYAKVINTNEKIPQWNRTNRTISLLLIQPPLYTTFKVFHCNNVNNYGTTGLQTKKHSNRVKRTHLFGFRC